jgi:hypothetical protein
MVTRPVVFGAACLPLLSRIVTLKPGTGLVEEPGLTVNGSMPMQFAVMASR